MVHPMYGRETLGSAALSSAEDSSPFLACKAAQDWHRALDALRRHGRRGVEQRRNPAEGAVRTGAGDANTTQIHNCENTPATQIREFSDSRRVINLGVQGWITRRLPTICGRKEMQDHGDTGKAGRNTSLNARTRCAQMGGSWGTAIIDGSFALVVQSGGSSVCENVSKQVEGDANQWKE
ncbi:hypothetical protein C8R44DRAFT_753101 [Mycena epipterygia]|nr:hypothetical protein C8R44DRAFT_753101 [Mycena epipterygia]